MKLLSKEELQIKFRSFSTGKLMSLASALRTDPDGEGVQYTLSVLVEELEKRGVSCQH